MYSIDSAPQNSFPCRQPPQIKSSSRWDQRNSAEGSVVVIDGNRHYFRSLKLGMESRENSVFYADLPVLSPSQNFSLGPGQKDRNSGDENDCCV